MPTSVNDNLVDQAIDHAISLNRFSNGAVRRVVSLLNQTDKELRAAIIEALLRLPADSFTVQRLEELLGSVRQLNLSAMMQVEAALQGEMRDLADFEAAFQVAALQDAFPEDARALIRFQRITPEQAYAAAMARPFQGGLLRDWTKSLGASRAAKVRETIRQGYVQGQTTDQIVRKIIGTKAKSYRDGVIDRSRREVESVVRTALSHTAEMAREKTIEANADLITAVRWVSTLDSRTSPQCFPSDTLALPVGDLRGISRRPWNGDLVIITTASGKKLRATPNHPVLTARGWRPMQEVEPGADVLYRVGVDVGGVSAAEDVEVPATMGAVFDALNKPAFGDVFVECTSEVDFHGDGVRGEHEINHPRTQGHLRLGIETAFGQEVAEKLLVFVTQPSFLFREGQVDEFLFGPPLIDVAPQVNTGSAKDRIKSRLADLMSAANVCGTSAITKELDKLRFVSPLGELTATDRGHNARPLQDTGNGRGRDAVVAADLSSRNAVGVVADDVVTVEREFFSGHVFNLQTGSELYIADGFVVHNCRLRDGKQYTPEDHRPIGHKVPWLQGPGRLHFNALASGTTILCSDGTKPIDAVKAGDLVLTHKGRFMPVIEARSKLSEDGIVRIVHTKSGRVIRATDDHPVLTTDGWKFVGALKIGDSLFQDAQQAAPVASFEGVVGATPEYGPALADQTDVSLQRALKLVSTNVDLYGDKEIGPCEIENGAAGLVLANPAIIKDQCLRHHLFALADALRELGRYRLGDLLADIERNAGPEHSLSCLGVEAVDLLGLLSSPHDFRAACGVVQGHSTRMSRVNIAGFLGHAPCPMVSSSFAGLPSGSVPDLDLLCPGSDSNAMISGVSGEASVCEAFLSLNVSQGHELSEVVFGNQVGVEAVSFLHDQIVAFEVQSYKGELFDLEVAEDCSYVAGCLVVSNCRSTQVPVTKSWRELGIDMDELEPSTRASMDGQVSAELTYSKWLQRQSRARQEEILGVTRAALVRDGKLPVDELYSDRGAYLTIEQLRAKYAETFKRAGL